MPSQRSWSSRDSRVLPHPLPPVCPYFLCFQPLDPPLCSASRLHQHLRLSPACLRTTPTSSACLRLPHFCLQPLWQFLRCPSNGAHQTPGKLKALCCDIHFLSYLGSTSLFSWISGHLPSYNVLAPTILNYLQSFDVLYPLTALCLSDTLPSVLTPPLPCSVLNAPTFLQDLVQNQLLQKASLVLSSPACSPARSVLALLGNCALW